MNGDTRRDVATDTRVPLLIERLRFEQGIATCGPSRDDAVAVKASRMAA